MKRIFLAIGFSLGLIPLAAQELSQNPDSLLSEWLEAGEWEGISLHPDIALDWLTETDTTWTRVSPDRSSKSQVFTMNVPVHSDLFDWLSDSGNLTVPVSLKYRTKVSQARRWEFRLQTNRNAGDTCLRLPEGGFPRQISSGFLIRPGEFFREIIIGDFQVNSGFGAVVGSSPVFSVSLGNPGSLHRTGKGIRLHSGTDEGRYFRGIAGSLFLGKSELIIYGSGKDRLNEEMAGMGWKKTFAKSEIGLTGIHIKSQFPPVVKEGWTAVWQPDSGRFSRLGIWGQTRLPFGIVFGELGASPNGGYGGIAGIRWFEANGFSAVLRYTGCSPGYPVAYSQFQSGTGLTREGHKIILSFRYARSRKLEWLGTVEVNGSDWPGTNARFNNTSTRLVNLIRFQSENQWLASGTVQFDFVESVGAIPEKLTWKMAFDSDPKQNGNLRFRAGFRQQVQGLGELLVKGSTADCSLTWLLSERKFKITGGFRVFTVETGTDPLYAYEPDVLYGWSAPVLSGSGTRWFATVRWKLLKTIDLELKIGQTAYTDLKHLSDGNRGGVSGKIQVAWVM